MKIPTGLIALLFLFQTASAFAATKVWTPSTSTTGAWRNSKNWNPNGIPGPADNAQIAAPTNGRQLIISLGDPLGDYVVGAIEVTSDNTTDRTIATANANGTITLNGGTVNGIANVILRNASASLLSIANGTSAKMDIALGNNIDNLINVDGSGGITIKNVIKNGAGNHLTFNGNGSGALTLSTANTYTGGTSINAGTFIATADNALGAGDVSLGATAKLTLQGGTQNNYIADKATLTIPNGTVVNLNFSGASDVIGGLVLGGAKQMNGGTYGGPGSGAKYQSAFFTGSGTLTLPQSPGPVINSAASDFNKSTLIITGNNFSSPTVTLSGTNLTVAASTATSITATLPDSITPGSYHLSVQQGDQVATLDVTLIGPAIPYLAALNGVPCVPGQSGIGALVVTVDGAGKVSFQCTPVTATIDVTNGGTYYKDVSGTGYGQDDTITVQYIVQGTVYGTDTYPADRHGNFSGPLTGGYMVGSGRQFKATGAPSGQTATYTTPQSNKPEKSPLPIKEK